MQLVPLHYGADAADAGAGAAAAGPITFKTFYGAADPPATYGYLGGALDKLTS
jgi:hypothetical protein